jgi:hypothetical protein
MRTSVTAAQPDTAETGTQTTGSEQLRAWATSQQGQQLWSAAHLTIAVDGVCHALDQVRAVTYALLISLQGTVILSAINPDTFARLEARYREAARVGLCFWWEGGILTCIEDSEAFLARIGTLPFPSAPLSQQHGHACSLTGQAQQEPCSTR